MIIPSIEAALRNLQESKLEAEESLLNEVKAKYSKQVADKVQAILSSLETESIEKSQEILSESLRQHGELIRGTMVDYTALPLHPATTLLESIACWLSENRSHSEPKAPIEFLYPDLSLETDSNDYPDLKVTEQVEGEKFSKEDEKTHQRLVSLKEDE